jgi:hypothetical protein
MNLSLKKPAKELLSEWKSDVSEQMKSEESII